MGRHGGITAFLVFLLLIQLFAWTEFHSGSAQNHDCHRNVIHAEHCTKALGQLAKPRPETQRMTVRLNLALPAWRKNPAEASKVGLWQENSLSLTILTAHPDTMGSGKSSRPPDCIHSGLRRNRLACRRWLDHV